MRVAIIENDDKSGRTAYLIPDDWKVPPDWKTVDEHITFLNLATRAMKQMNEEK